MYQAKFTIKGDKTIYLAYILDKEMFKKKIDFNKVTFKKISPFIDKKLGIRRTLTWNW